MVPMLAAAAAVLQPVVVWLSLVSVLVVLVLMLLMLLVLLVLLVIANPKRGQTGVRRHRSCLSQWLPVKVSWRMTWYP